MEILPLISTLLIVLSAILVAVGWRLIIKGEKEKHKKAMVAAAISALSFLIIYVSRTIFIGNTSFGGPESIKIYYTIFLIFHILLSMTGAVFGVVTLRLAFKGNFKKHKKIGPVTSIIWFFTAITGVIVYLLLYVIYHGGETTSMIRAILGY
ncbi:DUF420 domain-containing protein [Pseudogracilibacillus sp. SE30717A]|uniref:DUF420 domain-containing protein n=1 Tax=Pseudogracilibacillus sp. SE30717A TaxID=3098293 RepID=UPI00300E0950